jgi:protein tyrosine/serine phosphatase
MRKGLPEAGDFIFNCQMGRGRTTTGMVSACLVSSTLDWDTNMDEVVAEDSVALNMYDTMDGPSEEEVYLAGMFSNNPHAVWYDSRQILTSL